MFEDSAVQTQSTYDRCFHVYMCSSCPKIYISMEKESKRGRERQIERKNKNTSDQTSTVAGKTRKIKHLRRVQHFLAGITLREQHEHGIRWRIPKNAKSQWKGLLKLYYDPENAEALHVDTISLPTALPCLKAARRVNACKCHEMSKFKIHVLRKWAVTATASEQCCARQPPKVTKKLEQSFQIHTITQYVWKGICCHISGRKACTYMHT